MAYISALGLLIVFGVGVGVGISEKDKKIVSFCLAVHFYCTNVKYSGRLDIKNTQNCVLNYKKGSMGSQRSDFYKIIESVKCQ